MPRKRKPRAPYRSHFEERIGTALEKAKVSFEYETLKLTYHKKPSVYTPDFILPNGIIVEAKGYLTQADRVKMKLVKDQHPHLDIRFIFQDPNKKLSKTSKTTYGKWAEKHGFKWASGLIPTWWLKEPRKEH